MLMKIFDTVFSIFGPVIAVVGCLITCFYITTMFDSKGTYNNTGRDFLKWAKDAISSAISSEISELTEKETKKD